MIKTFLILSFIILAVKAHTQIVGLPCPNSSTKAGGPWSYEEAEKRKSEIYDMKLTPKQHNWVNPTSGGAIHINTKDEIEVYQFTFGIYQGRNDTAAFYVSAPKDTSVIVKTDELWNYVSGVGFGNETSVLITSEYDLKKSESIKKYYLNCGNPGFKSITPQKE